MARRRDCACHRKRTDGSVRSGDECRPSQIAAPCCPIEPTGTSRDSISALKRDRIIRQERGLEDHIQYNCISIGSGQRVGRSRGAVDHIDDLVVCGRSGRSQVAGIALSGNRDVEEWIHELNLDFGAEGSPKRDLVAS